MIRLTFALRRQRQLSLSEFQTYWRETHGPLVAGLATRLGILRYVQVHTLDDPFNAAMAESRGGMEPAFDGVAELWFASEKAVADALASDDGAAAGQILLEDEAKFIDLPASPLWLAHDYPQVNPTPENLLASPRSDLVKLHYPLRQLPGHDEADAQAYWRTTHGPLIRRQAAASGIKRYMQVHRVPSPLEAAMRDARGTTAPPFMGHAELWFARTDLGVSSPERQLAGRRAAEDEANFIDFARSSIFLGKEFEFVNRLND
ncbi:MAG: EthD domain-containing protein [Pseudomonadaceae bacterium]|nr:EthD domain-containing protein [Pseudomonadaceae bacterium]